MWNFFSLRPQFRGHSCGAEPGGGKGFPVFHYFGDGFPKACLGGAHRTVRARSSLKGFSVWERVLDTRTEFVLIICSKPAVRQMQCMDLSIVVVSELGVPGGFSTSVGVRQGGVCFQILCWGLVLWHGLCCSPLLPVGTLWPWFSRLPAELSWIIRWETLRISPCHIELGHF